MLFPLASLAGIQQNLLAGPADGNRSGTVRAIIVTKYFFEISPSRAERVSRRCFLKENYSVNTLSFDQVFEMSSSAEIRLTSGF